jgi:hypothetical protein
MQRARLEGHARWVPVPVGAWLIIAKVLENPEDESFQRSATAFELKQLRQQMRFSSVVRCNSSALILGGDKLQIFCQQQVILQLARPSQ